MNIQDVPPNDLIEQVAKKLKDEGLEQPEWAPFVKTGIHKERPPVSNDWFYVRAAAILRKVQLTGPIGTAKLRTKFGGRQRRGHKPERFQKAAGNHIRKALQGLEKLELVKHGKKGNHKGRIITPKGASLLHQAAKEVAEQNA